MTPNLARSTWECGSPEFRIADAGDAIADIPLLRQGAHQNIDLVVGGDRQDHLGIPQSRLGQSGRARAGTLHDQNIELLPDFRTPGGVLLHERDVMLGPLKLHGQVEADGSRPDDYDHQREASLRPSRPNR